MTTITCKGIRNKTDRNGNCSLSNCEGTHYSLGKVTHAVICVEWGCEVHSLLGTFVKVGPDLSKVTQKNRPVRKTLMKFLRIIYC